MDAWLRARAGQPAAGGSSLPGRLSSGGTHRSALRTAALRELRLDDHELEPMGARRLRRGGDSRSPGDRSWRRAGPPGPLGWRCGSEHVARWGRQATPGVGREAEDRTHDRAVCTECATGRALATAAPRGPPPGGEASPRLRATPVGRAPQCLAPPLADHPASPPVGGLRRASGANRPIRPMLRLSNRDTSTRISLPLRDG